MEMNGTTVIAKPVDVVFAYVNDATNDVNWRSGLTDSGLQEGETMGLGAKGYARAGDVEAGWEVTSYTAGESVDWNLTSGPLVGRGGYRLVPVDGGTQFTLVADIQPTGLYKLLGPIFGWIGRRQNQSDVEKLPDILEAT